MIVKNVYVAPVVELLEARVEKGFAGSGNGQEFNPGDLESVPASPESVDDDEFMGR